MTLIRPLLVLLLVVSAGCAGADPSGPRETATDAPTPSAPPRTAQPSTPERTLATPTADNPWGREPVVVGIQNKGNPDRDFRPTVERAIAYWQNEGRPHATWEPNFVLRPSDPDPDLIVYFVDDVRNCGYDDDGDTIGCASLLTPDRRARDPEVARIDAHLNANSTYDVVRHELGHILGVEHGTEPGPFMAATTSVGREVRTDEPYRLFIEFPNNYAAEERSTRQVRHALDYYESGAEGWLQKNATFEIVEDRSGADIVVRVTKDSPAGSIADVEAGTIRLDGLPHTRHGWHVGYWLGYLLVSESPDDMPPAFDEPATDEREEWW